MFVDLKSKIATFTMSNKKQPPQVFYKKATPKNFSIFTRKYLCWGLFLIKLQDLRSMNIFYEYCEIFKNAYFEENL